MNGVIGMTDNLLESDLTPGQREHAEIVRSSGNALLDLINDLLDFSKIEAGKLELEDIPFSLERLAEEVGDILAIRAQSKSLEFVVKVGRNVPECVMGDPVRLRQVLINLGNNTIKFTECGEVQIVVNVGPRPGEIQVHVIDTGIGIPADRISRLFESFSQVDASTTRKYGGTGLGLAISKQLVEAMGGVIEVESEVGKGTDFHFTCRLPESDPSALETRGGLVNLESGLNVLVVDDKATNRFYLREVLQHWNCNVIEAEDGPIALDVLAGRDQGTELFDLILLDYQMPDMNGVELARRIRELPACSQVPMILLTSIHHSEADGWKSAGIQLCLTKPIKKSHLLGGLNRAIDGEPASRPQAVASKKSRIEFAGESILLVEDNPVNQKIAMPLLKKSGLDVDVVNNGREAVEAYERNSYDLILMDCQMPEMDGSQATRAIRALEDGGPGIPIVAMTANALKGDRERCIDAGMND